jgi:hypothetical protein
MDELKEAREPRQQDEGAEQAEPQGDAAKGQEPDYKALWEAERAKSSKWEKRAKEANSKALDEANAKLEEIRSERDALAAEKQRRETVDRVAAATGLPASVVGALSGGSEEELTEQAERVKESVLSQGSAWAYPQTRDRGETPAKTVTADNIRAIKDTRERIRERAEHKELFR